MISLTDIVPRIRKLNGFSSDQFKNRNGIGHFVFINEVTKQFYETKTINAEGYLRGIERVLRGIEKHFSERLSTALLSSGGKDWSLYFHPDELPQTELEKIHAALKDYQHLRRHSTRTYNQEKTTWVYVVTHKESGRRLHILADQETNHEAAVGLFMRKWKQNNNDGLDRKVISLNTYYQCMRDFQKAAEAFDKGQFLGFDYYHIDSLQNVTRNTAREHTTNSNRVDTIKYYQSAYNRSREYAASVENHAQV